LSKCLNCQKELDSLSEFCSDKCSEEWQSKNQTCSNCEKEMNLLEEEYTIKHNGEKSIVLCLKCGHSQNVPYGRPTGGRYG